MFARQIAVIRPQGDEGLLSCSRISSVHTVVLNVPLMCWYGLSPSSVQLDRIRYMVNICLLSSAIIGSCSYATYAILDLCS